MPTIEFFSMIFIRKGKKIVSKQGQSQPHVYSEARVTLLDHNYNNIIMVYPQEQKWQSLWDSSVVITPEKSL